MLMHWILWIFKSQ